MSSSLRRQWCARASGALIAVLAAGCTDSDSKRQSEVASGKPSPEVKEPNEDPVEDEGGIATDASKPVESRDGGAVDVHPKPEQDAATLEDGSWQKVSRSFGLVEHVAGAGRGDNLNEWDEAFEGQLATEVELSRPHMAMSDDAGNIFIADKEAHGIRLVSPSGELVTVAGTNVAGDGPDEPTPALEVALSNPNGVWVQPDGTAYVVDLGNAKIRKLSADGMMQTLFSVPSLIVGRGLWVAPDESEVLVASGSQILRWTPESGVTVLMDSFSQLGMVLRVPGGEIWAADRTAHRVYAIATDGQRRVLAGNGTTLFEDGALATETGLDEPRAVWPYAGGFFVGLHEGSRIVYVDDLGRVHSFIDGAPGAHGGDGEPFDSEGLKVSELRSLVVTPAGDLLFVESDEGFVRRVRGLDDG